MDITQLILDDHHEQRRQFALIEQFDLQDTVGLGAVWNRLATFPEVHAKAEEVFYPSLLHVGRAAGEIHCGEAEAKDAIKDHNEICDAVTEVGRYNVRTDAWLAAVAAANQVNSDHVGEEERQGLTEFRKLAALQLRHELAVAFVRLEAMHQAGVQPNDKNPEKWVAQHG